VKLEHKLRLIAGFCMTGVEALPLYCKKVSNSVSLRWQYRSRFH